MTSSGASLIGDNRRLAFELDDEQSGILDQADRFARNELVSHEGLRNAAPGAVDLTAEGQLAAWSGAPPLAIDIGHGDDTIADSGGRIGAPERRLGRRAALAALRGRGASILG